MFIEERQQLIINQLEKDGKVIASDLATKFNVSIDTIRRDLIFLEENGFLKRTRGGAIPKPQGKIVKPKNFTGRDIKEIDPFYDSIAKCAASYIKEGDNIYLGYSSIDYLMIKYLPKNFNYTVITNSVVTADELRYFDNIDIYMTCGKVRAGGSMRDAMTINFIKNIRIDKAFIAGPTLSHNFGLSNTSFEVTAIQKAIIESSKELICLIPNIKLGVDSLSKIVDARDINKVITDWEATFEEVSNLRDLGVQVIIAEENK